jgi:hypothetical protein
MFGTLVEQVTPLLIDYLRVSGEWMKDMKENMRG